VRKVFKRNDIGSDFGADLEAIMAGSNRGRVVLIWALRILLSFFFLVIGVSKLTGTLQTVEFFTAIGWGQWFRYLTGVLDLVGAALLLTPRWIFFGALILTCTVGSATLICIFLLRQSPLVPLVFALLAVSLAWLTRLSPKAAVHPPPVQ
jgi:putative oxidoreductase